MTILFSDGFETGNLSQWTSQSVSPPVVQSAIKRFGNYALKGDLSDAAQTEQTVKDLGANYTEAHYRTYVMIDAAPAPAQFVAMFDNSLGPVGGTDPYWYMQVGNSLNMVLNMASIPPAGETSGFIFQMVAGVWYCVEVLCKVSAVAGQFTVWVDGNQVYDNSGVDNTLFGAAGVRYLRAGYTFCSSPYAGNIYTDAVAFSDDQYIGLEQGLWMQMTGTATLQ